MTTVRTLAPWPDGRCATPKPDKFARKAKERGEDREHAKKRDQCRRTVVRQDRHQCRRCGRKVHLKPADALTAFQIAHVHEFVWRSHGGDDTDPTNCVTLCAECHPLVHARQVGIAAREPIRLMRGPIDFYDDVTQEVRSR